MVSSGCRVVVLARALLHSIGSMHRIRARVTGGCLWHTCIGLHRSLKAAAGLQRVDSSASHVAPPRGEVEPDRSDAEPAAVLVSSAEQELATVARRMRRHFLVGSAYRPSWVVTPLRLQALGSNALTLGRVKLIPLGRGHASTLARARSPMGHERRARAAGTEERVGGAPP